uniref:Uncharacterized protein n=2 Tax=Timema TaxID=61471 RepID=A0A7R9IRL0_9NEOP|nr:unnamed protein product [Timema bartmani]CAD7463280.1 unnamed protein product [Timema tahoe]
MFSQTRTMLKTLTILAVVMVATLVQARPQEGPMPYDFEWKVDDSLSKNYYSQTESSNAVGRVDGSYQVLLADGRLMTVTYFVDGESGFVPKITYENNANPFGK